MVRHRCRQRLHHRASERQNSSHNRARASGGRGGRRRGGGSRSHPLPHTLAGLSPGVNSKCLSLFPIFFDFTGRDAVIFPLTPGGGHAYNKPQEPVVADYPRCNDRGAESQEYPAYPAMGQSTPPEKGPFRRRAGPLPGGPVAWAVGITSHGLPHIICVERYH